MLRANLIFKTININILSAFYGILLCALIFFVALAHAYKLESIPAGVFFDEATIGYDAGRLALNGFDDYGGQFQFFFETTADFDSPILIYSAALIFKLFGISEANLRLTNAIFFLAALLISLWLGMVIFKNQRGVWFYLIIAFGFLPQFFTLSRLAFEVTTQLTFTAATTLAIWWTFHSENLKRFELVKAIIGGLLIGISTYTYSTASLLSALMVLSVWIVYFSKANIKKLISLSVASLVALIPYIIFVLFNPNALTSRFRSITYLFDQTSVTEKILMFLSNYFAHWSPGFLFFQGDSNLRHATGIGGMVFCAVGILFIIGLFVILFKQKLPSFQRFLFINLLFSPVAAALIVEGTPHAIRSLLLGYYILIISCYGLGYLFESANARFKAFALTFIFGLLVFEVLNYQADYFFQYPARSVDAMGSYDFRSAFEFSIEQNPIEINLLDHSDGSIEIMQFYNLAVNNPNIIPIQTISWVLPIPGICIIYNRLSDTEDELDKSLIPYVEFRSKSRPTAFEKSMGTAVFFGVIKARCYERSEEISP